jgi:succinate-semialdehyde dehydrogenase / glutarate-semialdehyde dehydrogenase
MPTEMTPNSARGLVSRNPTSGEILRRFEFDSDAEIERKLQRAVEAFEKHRRADFAERARRMRRLSEMLEAEKQPLGRIMTLEMGKPIRAAVQEAEKCANACRYYAEHASAFLADEPAGLEAGRAFVRYQPLGAVLAIMPWNFPFWQVFRFAAPALMAGNVGLLKHASNVPQCAVSITNLFCRAGFTEGVFQALMVGSDRVERVILDDRVSAVTLTGSVGAGSSVAATAGKAIKKTVLELGGSDPFIVMPSADLEAAVRTAVLARTINNGQSCIAAKRFIVHRKIAAEFERRFVDRMRTLRVGDPMEETTDIGPLATEDVLRLLTDQVQRTLRMGGRLLLGGKQSERPGFFFEPTVLTDVPPESPACHEEMFGPVASLFRAESFEEAIDIANRTQFGLGACLWTQDARERDLFVDQIQAGLAFVNGMVASDPRLPFGGVKQSGYGRELGRLGILEFVNAKTVVINEARPQPNQADKSD